MDTQQLLDALTDHKSLFHRHKENCDSRRNIEADKIKLWMEGLNVKQRQAALTVVDSSCVALVLKMQERLEKDGSGFFFLLPDLPVPAGNGGQNVGQCLKEKRKLKQKIGRKGRSKVAGNSSQHAKHSDEKWDGKMHIYMKGSNDKEFGLHFGLSLPSLCFRKAQGLLRRLTGTQMAEDLLLDNIQLFSSQDGDKGICYYIEISTIAKSGGHHRLQQGDFCPRYKGKTYNRPYHELLRCILEFGAEAKD